MDLLKNKSLLKELSIPILMNKNHMMTINNYAKIHWATKSKIKNEYKSLLNDWFMDGEKLPEDCHFVWEPIYKDNRRRDSINMASIAKIIEDVFVATGSFDDDNQTEHTFLKGTRNTKAAQHMLRVQIYGPIKENKKQG